MQIMAVRLSLTYFLNRGKNRAMQTKLKKYIQEVKGITIREAAGEIGLSRPHLTYLCNGLPAGRSAAKKIREWSGGMLTEQDVMFPVVLE
jgi:hypothetical protein